MTIVGKCIMSFVTTQMREFREAVVYCLTSKIFSRIMCPSRRSTEREGKKADTMERR